MTAEIKSVLPPGQPVEVSGEGLPPANTKLPSGSIYTDTVSGQKYTLRRQFGTRYWLPAESAAVVQRDVDTDDESHIYIGVSRVDDTWAVYRYERGDTNAMVAEGALNYAVAWTNRTGLTYL